MDIYQLKTIETISVVAWLLPAIRQFRTFYFYYFLILALSDPAATVIEMLNKDFIVYLYLVTGILCIWSLLEEELRKKIWIYALSGAVLLAAFLYYTLNNYDIVLSFFLVLRFIVLLQLLKRFVISFATENLLNIYLLLLMFYELMIISKIYNYFSQFTQAYEYYFITTAFQVLIAIFFIIFRTDDPKFIRSL